MSLKQHFFYSVACIIWVMCSIPALAAGNTSTNSSSYSVIATNNEDSDGTQPVSQLETQGMLSWYNHAVFNFNDMLDKAILKPIAKLYNKLAPRPLRQGVTNFFSNIDNITTVINDILQLQAYYALNDGWRLFVNSTVGVLGFIDVGSRIGLKPHHEDFGLTLARWGYKNSNYIMVPFLGPGTIRDIIGWPVDYFFFSIYPCIRDQNMRYGVYGLGAIDRRANMLQHQDVYAQVAIDRYSFIRNAYLQHRQYQINENLKPKDNKEDLNEI